MERDEDNPQRLQRFANFNSHAHVERDEHTGILMQYQKISTHTLTWSVTYIVAPKLDRRTKISTHTLTWSVTYNGKNGDLNVIFQLTRSRGA